MNNFLLCFQDDSSDEHKQYVDDNEVSGNLSLYGDSEEEESSSSGPDDDDSLLKRQRKHLMRLQIYWFWRHQITRM